MQIKKVKLTKALRLEVSYKKEEADGSTSQVDEKHNSKAHDDFVTSMNSLRVHFGMLTGYLNPGEIRDPDVYMTNVDSFHVSGYSIGGEDEDQGIVITGHRILPSGKAIILNSPFTRFNEDEATRYKHMDKLIARVEEVRSEAVKYLGGKFFKEPQQELLFNKPELEEALT